MELCRIEWVLSMENKTSNSYENIIARIQKMEQYMDDVSEVLQNCPESIKENEEVKVKITELENYQESGQWLLDYVSDERGELPSDLKRGVLSEDMLYNLLCDVRLWM